MSETEAPTGLEESIEYRFSEPLWLSQALTHKSYRNEHPGFDRANNERLEFLGDAVLDLVVSDLIFRNHPDFPEGEMTRVRAEVVSEGSLAAIGRRLDLGHYLLLGRGEDKSGGRDKDSLLANAFEALIGAVYSDGGIEAARAMVERQLAATVARSAKCKAGIDFKTRLQEHLQARFGKPPSYRLLQAEGPDHRKLYTVAVEFAGDMIGQGEGRTKKGAEQEAARQALAKLED